MDLTNEQVELIVAAVLNKLEPRVKEFATKQIEDLDIPDTRNLATKKFVTDGLEALRVAITDELTKTNVAVTKIATDTETKITELTTKKSSWSDMFKTVLDYD